jgi:hypothetical protein
VIAHPRARATWTPQRWTADGLVVEERRSRGPGALVLVDPTRSPADGRRIAVSRGSAFSDLFRTP